jgi:hypothetical protein
MDWFHLAQGEAQWMTRMTQYSDFGVSKQLQFFEPNSHYQIFKQDFAIVTRTG